VSYWEHKYGLTDFVLCRNSCSCGLVV